MPTVRERIGTVLDPPPDDLVAHFEAGDPPHDPELGIERLPLDEAVEYSRDLHAGTLPGRPMGLFAVLDASDSNPFCYVSRGSVLHFYHDGDPAIEFASLAAFRAALADAVRDGVDIHDLPPGKPPRVGAAELREHLERLRRDGSDEADFEWAILAPLAESAG